MDGYWIFFQFIYGMYVKLANPRCLNIHFFQPGTRVVIGGTVDGKTYVGEGFIFGYSPPILDKNETIEDVQFSSVNGVNELKFTKSTTLDRMVVVKLK